MSRAIILVLSNLTSFFSASSVRNCHVICDPSLENVSKMLKIKNRSFDTKKKYRARALPWCKSCLNSTLRC